MKQKQKDHAPAVNFADDETEAGTGATTCMSDFDDDDMPRTEVCDECNKAREEEELRNELHFTNQIIYVKHVAKPPEASCGDGDCASDASGGRRKSRRSRAGKAFQTYTVLVSSAETLSDLKLKVSTRKIA